MKTFVISEEDRHDLLEMLGVYRPYLRSEVEQIEILRRKLEQAVIVPAPRLAPSIVAMGSAVRVVDLGPRQESTYTLVPPMETDLARHRLSVLSPLGTAILGCTEGAIVDIRLPVGSALFGIREVLPPPLVDSHRQHHAQQRG